MSLTHGLAVDPFDVGVIAREFHDHSIGVGHIHRTAIAVFQHERLRFLETRILEPLLDPCLRLLIDPEGDVVKRRERHPGAKLLLIPRIRELEERQRPTVA